MTVIIPSKSAENLIHSAAAVQQLEPNARIIVADDGVEWYRVPQSIRNGLEVLPCPQPFVYARNCNLGIQACDDDVVLLNDDAILKTPLGFTTMSMYADDCAVISATTNLVGNPRQQRVRDEGIRLEPKMLCFVCVYIPRTALDEVGLLDERFVNYGFDDDDYCMRVQQAGLRLGICDGCFVDHLSLRSSYRWNRRCDPEPNRELFLKKWNLST